jgi:formylmethanofuran dehydrogenase subunit A
MISRNKKILLVSIIVILVLAAVISWVLFSSQTFTITEYISDNDSKTFSFSGYCSRLSFSLTATTDDMSIKLIVDGITVNEWSNTDNTIFTGNMGFGDHTILIYMENPSIFGLGSTILVSGKITISLF